MTSSPSWTRSNKPVWRPDVISGTTTATPMPTSIEWRRYGAFVAGHAQSLRTPAMPGPAVGHQQPGLPASLSADRVTMAGVTGLLRPGAPGERGWCRFRALELGE